MTTKSNVPNILKAPPPPPVPASPSKPRSLFGRACNAGKKIGIYGPGGIGKTSLALMAPGPIAIFDLDGSMGELAPDAACVVQGMNTYQDVRDALAAPGAWDGVKTIIVDSATALQDLAEKYVVKNVPHEKGHSVKSVEDYGYGKGYKHIFDAMMLVIADLEAHTRAGRNIVFTMHDEVVSVPSPQGEDWLRYEPRIMNIGKTAQLRPRMREWLSYLFFVGYDVVAKDGKGKGGNTRTCYTREQPHCMAKRRTELPDAIQYIQNDPAIWDMIFHPTQEEN